MIDKTKYQLECNLSVEEKQRTDELRLIDIYEVAKIFGENSYPASVDFKGKKKKINNCIDYLVCCQELSFSGAIKFLIEQFGEVSTARTIANAVKDVKKEIPKSTKVKIDLIKKEFEALNNPVVRITMQHPKTKKAIVIGKDEYDEEKFYNYNQVIGFIERLNFYNTDEQGFNIYITPIEFELKRDKIAILIDDVKKYDDERQINTYQETISNLGNPNLIMETSKDNYQFVYLLDNKIDYGNSKKKLGKEKDRNDYNEFFIELNRKFGDKTINGLRHPFRLAGYANKKKDRDNFFTKIIYANSNPDNRIEEAFEEFKARNAKKAEMQIKAKSKTQEKP